MRDSVRLFHLITAGTYNLHPLIILMPDWKQVCVERERWCWSLQCMKRASSFCRLCLILKARVCRWDHLIQSVNDCKTTWGEVEQLHCKVVIDNNTPTQCQRTRGDSDRLLYRLKTSSSGPENPPPLQRVQRVPLSPNGKRHTLKTNRCWSRPLAWCCVS